MATAHRMHRARQKKEESMLLWRKRSIPLAMGMMLTIALIVLSWVMTQPTQAGQEYEQVNDTVPFTNVETNPCTGDVVTYEGTIHLVRTVTERHGRTHIVDHMNIHGLGVDERGVKYTISQISNGSYQVGDTTGAVSRTVEFLFHMQRQGESDTPDDFMSTAVIHYTINANQITVTDFDMRSEQCTPANASPNASASSGAATAGATASAQ